MRKSKVLEKIRNGGFVRMCGLGHFMPFFLAHAAYQKYDGIWLDLEHRAMDDRDVLALLAMGHRHDIDIMVRTPTLQRTRLYRYLEDGASGLMIPFGSTPEIARDVVECAKFPPEGNRGIDGAGRDADFGFAHWKPGATFTEDANRETFIVCQIETPEAVANVDEIAAVPGVDVLFIGPGDLGLRIDKNPAVSLTIEEAVETVAAAAKSQGKAWGITAGSPEDVAKRRSQGAQIVPWGGDFLAAFALEKCSKELDEIVGEG